MKGDAEHHLIANTVKSILDRCAPGLSNVIKNAIAIQCAIALKQLVRVKERDEE